MIRMTREDMLDIHKMLADETGGSRGLRDEGLLDSALNAPFHTFDGEDLYPTIEEKAASLGHSIIMNHPFVDGNKRIGILAMMTFLEINDTQFKMTDAIITALTIGIADGIISRDELADIVIEYSTAVLGDDVDTYLKRRRLHELLSEEDYEQIKGYFIDGELTEKDLSGIIQMHNYKKMLERSGE